MVRQHLTSDIVAGNTEILQKARDGISIQAHIETIEFQMVTMFQVVDKANKHFWSALADPGSYPPAEAKEFIIPGSIDEMHAQVRYAYHAWEETPGAIDWVRGKLRQ